MKKLILFAVLMLALIMTAAACNTGDDNGEPPVSTDAVTEAPTEAVTEQPTEAPTTAEPTTEAPTSEPTTEAKTEEPTEAPTTEAPAQKGGCGAVISGSAIIAIAVLAVPVFVRKKRD